MAAAPEDPWGFDDETIDETFKNELRDELPHLHLENLSLLWFKFIFLHMTRTGVRNLLRNIHDQIRSDIASNPPMPPICPNLEDIWRWTSLLEPEKVKVVIVGLDPYYSYMKRESDGQCVLASNGYGYSMNSEYFLAEYRNRRLSSTWQSITRMMCSPFQLDQRKHLYFGDGNLNSWYEQGVCMFDYNLTTRGRSRAHDHFGWQNLTRLIVQRLAEGKAKKRVFMFWGSILRRNPILDQNEHFVIYRCNPSACRMDQGEICCSWQCWNVSERNCFNEVDSYVRRFSDETIRWDPLEGVELPANLAV